MFTLFQLIFVTIAIILDNIFGITFGSIHYGPLYVIYMLVTLLPSLAVAVRRLHDVGKSGWFYLIILIPLVGAIWLLILDCTEGTFGPNQYGEDPKEAERNAMFPPFQSEQTDI